MYVSYSTWDLIAPGLTFQISTARSSNRFRAARVYEGSGISRAVNRAVGPVTGFGGGQRDRPTRANYQAAFGSP